MLAQARGTTDNTLTSICIDCDECRRDVQRHIAAERKLADDMLVNAGVYNVKLQRTVLDLIEQVEEAKAAGESPVIQLFVREAHPDALGVELGMELALLLEEHLNAPPR